MLGRAVKSPSAFFDETMRTYKRIRSHRHAVSAWDSAMLAATAFAAPPRCANEVWADSPIGCWCFGEATATNAADSFGNGHDGTYSGSYAGPDRRFGRHRREESEPVVMADAIEDQLSWACCRASRNRRSMVKR